MFTPTLFCGAALGLLYGTGMHALLPGAAPVPVSYAVVGMGALLAATTHAPLMSILMIFEMTLSYQVVPPLMLTCITGDVAAHATAAPSVYARALARNREDARDDAQHLPPSLLPSTSRRNGYAPRSAWLRPPLFCARCASQKWVRLRAGRGDVAAICARAFAD